MGMSIRAYARHRGVSHVAVKKAIDAGRITPEADGSINSERADQDWTANTSQPKHSMKQASRSATSRTQESLVSPSVEPSESPTKSMSLLTARTAHEVLKAQTSKVKLSQLKGDLIDKSDAVALFFKLARAERDGWLNWPSRVSASIAAALGTDAHKLHLELEAAVRENLTELGELSLRIE